MHVIERITVYQRPCASMNFNKRFSIAHYDRFQREHTPVYYEIMKNANPKFLGNLHDIYFGKFFYYKYKGKKKRSGNPMGVEASDEQVDYLFRIQKELGVEISLTFNTIEIPSEIAFDPVVTEQFVEWIGSYYDRGLRSCTMSSEHILRMGVLQQRCPDMRWKSTVNQIVADAQRFIDYACLGYDTIQLDRSLNRNICELKRIRSAQEYLNKKARTKPVVTSLLVAEACLYHCPFKREHDRVGEVIGTDYFDGPANLSCKGWRENTNFTELPRSGINMVVSSAEAMKEFGNLVDVFKYSGRFTMPMFSPEDAKHIKAVWYYSDNNKFCRNMSPEEEMVYAEDFAEIAEGDLAPLHSWLPGWIDTRYVTKDWRATYEPYTGIWSTGKGKRLERILRTCRSQCWNCHKCERTFGVEDVDSALKFRKQ